MKHQLSNQKGFTIVELMIATTVFSVILMAITGATMTIGKQYQKSMYASNTQAAASNLVDTLSQSIRFSSGIVSQNGNPAESNTASPNAGTATYCIGNRQILYTYGRKVGDVVSETSTKYAVVSRPNDGCNIDAITGNTPALINPKELLGRGMRLSKLTITQPTATYYRIDIRVVYGDDDLLCSDSVSNSCNAGSGTMSDANLRNTDLRCKPGKGSEFCSVSELSTVVYQRL